MSLLSRIQAAWAALSSSSGGLSARRVTTDMPDWALQFLNHAFWLTERQLGHIDAFLLDPMVNAAVTQVQDDFASLRVKVYGGRGAARKEFGRSHTPPGLMLKPRPEDLAELLYRANPNETGRSLRAATAGSLKLTGNAYWFLQYFGTNPVPQELWLLQGQLTRPVPGKDRTMAGYEFNSTGSGDWSFIPAQDERGRPLVVHFRSYNPKDEPVGLAAIEALESVYSGRYYALQWVKNFFLKGGMMAGVWKQAAGSAPLKTEEAKAMIETLKRTHMGFDKAFNPIILDQLEFVQQGMKLSEMELDKQLGIMNAEIMRALGVPPVVLGVKEGGGLSDAGAMVDLRLYWHGTQKRLAETIDDTVTERLAPLFGQDVEVETDLGEVLVVQNDRLDQAKAHVALVQGGIETPNEARLAIGYPPVNEPDADLLRQPSAPFGAPVPAGLSRTREVEGEVETVRPRRLGTRRALMIEGDPNREALRLKHSAALDKAQSKMHALIVARIEEQRAAAKRELGRRWSEAHPASMTRAGKAVKLASAIDISNLIPEGSEEDRAKAEAILKRLLKERADEALGELSDLTGSAVEADVALNTARAIRFLEDQLTRAIDVPDQTTAEGLRRTLQEGLTQGEGLADLTARVDSFFSGRRDNALTIARTETLPGYNFGAREAWMQVGVDQVEWLSARDDAVRPTHADADGQTAPVDGSFEIGGESLQYPGDPNGSPDETINCLPGDQRVAGLVLAASKAFYAGPIIEIETVRGHRLTVTVNHPVLTPRGFVPAGQLREGDDVLCEPLDIHRRSARWDVQDEQRPPTIEQVFEALRLKGTTRALAPRAADFYGDGRFFKSEIEIVTAGVVAGTTLRPSLYRELMLKRERVVFSEQDHQIDLIETNLAVAVAGGFVCAAAPRSPCRAQLAADSPRIASQASPLEGLGGALIPGFEPGIGKSERDDVSRHAVLGREPQHARASLEGRHDARRIELVDVRLEPCRLGATADLEPRIADPPGHGIALDASQLATDLLCGHAGRIAPDRVRSLLRRDFQGPVFDVHTAQGYFAGGESATIIQRNCRCVLIPVVGTSSLSRRRWDGYWKAHRNGTSPEVHNRLRSYFKQGA